MNGADSYLWHEDPLPVPERITRMLFIGIDPGVSGGIAAIDEHGQVHGTFKMPETGRDVWELLDEIDSRWHHPPVAVRAVIEKVNAGVFGKPGQRMGVVSAFTFGRNVERCHMALIAAGIPFDEVLPAKWQTVMSCRTRGDKNISKARAQQLFPTVKVTHAIADALLIAEYARRTERGSLHSAPEPKGLFDVEETAEEKEIGDRLYIPPGFYEGKGAAQAEAVAQSRRGRAPRRRHPKASATGTAARRGRRSRLEGDR